MASGGGGGGGSEQGRRTRRRKRSSGKMEDEYTSKLSHLGQDISHTHTQVTSHSSSRQPIPQMFQPEYDFRQSTRRRPRRKDSGPSVLSMNSPTDHQHSSSHHHLRTPSTSSSDTSSNPLSHPTHNLSEGATRTDQSDLTLDVLFQMDGGTILNRRSGPGHVSGTNLSSTSQTDQTSQQTAPLDGPHTTTTTTTLIDDLFVVDRSPTINEETSDPVPYTVDVHHHGDRDEVIVVESDDDGEEDEEDVVVLHESRVDPDELMARRLRETFGSAVSTRSATSRDETSGSSSGELIRDNMEALATRIDTWTVADARRFLMVTLPPGHRGAGRMHRQSLERHLTRTHPMLLYAAIMGRPSMLPPGLSSMGSYEDLLELAEHLGPARSNGLSEEAIALLPTKSFINGDNLEDPSKLSCVICMSEYHKNDTLTTLPCLHDFHSSCINPWLKNQKTCPVCRSEVVPTP